MAEKHEYLVARFRARLRKSGYHIEARSPFVDYRPDVHAVRGLRRIFAEVEIDGTLYGEHTRRQLGIMYRYLVKSKRNYGALVVPRSLKREATFLVRQVFGDRKIRVEAL